jgi:hypothetical protein
MDKKEKMYALVEQWKGSGITRKKFASQHSVSEESFGYWCKKYENQPSSAYPSPVTPPAFVELSLEAGTEVKPRVLQAELEFAGGLRLKIYA